MTEKIKGLDDSAFAAIGLGGNISKKEQEIETIKMGTDIIVSVELEESEEDYKARQEELKNDLINEISSGVEEKLKSKVVQELKEEQEKLALKLEEDKERLREETYEEAFQEVWKKSSDLEHGNLTIVDNKSDDETEVMDEKSKKKSKKEANQQDVVTPMGITQVYVGQGVGVERKKVSIFKKLLNKFKDIVVTIIILEFVLFIGVILTDLVNPSLELDITATFKQINATGFTLIKNIIHEIWVFIQNRYLQK